MSSSVHERVERRVSCRPRALARCDMTTAIWSRRTVTNLVVSLGAAVSLAVPVSRAAAQECAAGNTRWIHQFGTTASDETWGVAVDATGSVYVVGNTEPPSLL